MTGLIASIVEAYGELRVNKLRILLALIGVAFSVFSLTAVLGAGGMMDSAIQQSIESQTGRPAIITVQPMDRTPGTTAEQADQVVLDEFDRLRIAQRSRQVDASVGVQTRQGVQQVTLTGVDPAWGDMHRVAIREGRWIADSDQRRLAPALVVNSAAYEKLGRPALGTGTVTMVGSDRSTVNAIVIGVTEDLSTDEAPKIFTPFGSLDEMPTGTIDVQSTPTTYLAWVPPELKDQVVDDLHRSLRSTPAGSFDAFDSSFSTQDLGFQYLQWGIIGIALVILLLGAMGLVNIALVTIRFRVREIGIRRSYGATGLRIFIGVLMESVVATVLAGAVGVTAAVALVRAPFVTSFFRSIGLVNPPPFPLTAVLIGLAAATTVGVLAGALPAFIATRIKVIDAIRS